MPDRIPLLTRSTAAEGKSEESAPLIYVDRLMKTESRPEDRKLPPTKINAKIEATTPIRIGYPRILCVVIASNFCSRLILGGVTIIVASLAILLAREYLSEARTMEGGSPCIF